MNNHQLTELASRLRQSASNPSAVESIAHELANAAAARAPKPEAKPEVKPAAKPVQSERPSFKK